MLRFLKMITVVGLIFWLFYTGKLSLNELMIFVSKPELILVSFSIWITTSILAGAIRWMILLRAVEYEISFMQVLQIHMIGMFFGTAIPGAIGGDVAKVTYLFTNYRSAGKTIAILSTLIDRFIGLFGLIIFAVIFIAYDPSNFLINTNLRTVAFLLIAFLVSCILTFGLLLTLDNDKNRLTSFFPKERYKIINEILMCFFLYRNKYKHLTAALCITLFSQWLLFLYFAFLTEIILHQIVPYSSLASIYTIGSIATAVPVAPGGIGVGHVAFDRLFRMIGLSNGAGIFNVFTLSLLGLNLVCAIPFIIFHKRSESSIVAEKSVVL